MGKARASRVAGSLIVMSLLLAGCDRIPGLGNAATADEATSANPRVGAKVNAYTESYNKLIGYFGLLDIAKRYRENRIAGQSPRDTIYVNEGAIEAALTRLKEARAMPGGTPTLDRAADALIAALDKVMARLGPLKTYYDSRAYRDDALARGKREDPLMLAEFDAAIAEAGRFDSALTATRHARLEGELARLKEAGNTLGYNTKVELKHAEDLLALFPTPAAIRDPANFRRGDALVATLETLLAEQRTAIAAAKAAASASDQPDSGHASVVDGLTSLIGDYRDLRQSKDPSEYESMIRRYNSAIDSANGID